MYLMIICDILLKGSGEFIHIEFDIVHKKLNPLFGFTKDQDLL